MPPAKRNIGVVFQNYALFPHLDVAQNLAFPLDVRGMRPSDIQRRVADALALVGLSGSADKLPGELSGGQQQRVALARALIFEPDMLLMDEPLGALDRRLRLQLQFELRRLHRELGVTVVYVTHDQEEALSMSDRIGVIADGCLQQVGTPREVYELPANRFVAEFLGDSNIVHGLGRQMSSDLYEVVGPGGLRIRCAAVPGPRSSEATVLIRPEHLRIVDGGAISDFALPGVVDEVMYVGDLTKYWIRMDDGGSRLLVKAPSSGIPSDPPFGSQGRGRLPSDGRPTDAERVVRRPRGGVARAGTKVVAI